MISYFIWLDYSQNQRSSCVAADGLPDGCAGSCSPCAQKRPEKETASEFQIVDDLTEGVVDSIGRSPRLDRKESSTPYEGNLDSIGRSPRLLIKESLTA